jgi:FKBP12-rapamycin complex-associated protein
MPEVFGLISELWENPSLQLPIVSLVESLGKALDAEFKPFLPNILPLILKIFDGELNEKRTNTQIQIFDALLTFGANIEEYLHLVIPIIVKSYERPDGTTALRKRAIQTIDGLSRRVNFSDHASRIVHPLVRVLESSNNELRMAVMDTLCSLVVQLGSDFAIFVPTINKVSPRGNIMCQRFTHMRSAWFAIASLIQNTKISYLNFLTASDCHKKQGSSNFCNYILSRRDAPSHLSSD